MAGHDGGLALYLEAVGGGDIQLLDGPPQVNQVHVALVVAAADGRGGVDQGHGRHGPGVVHGHLQAPHLHGQLLGSVAASHQPRALGQQVAEAPAMGDHLDQLGYRLSVAPVQLPSHLARPDDALLIEIVGEGDGASRADGVQAVGVAEVAQVGHGGQVVEEKEGAQGADRLVLRPLGLGQSIFVQPHPPLAGHRAAVAGVDASEDGLGHGRAAELLAFWERALSKVTDRRVAQKHVVVEGAGGARLAQDGGGDVLFDGGQSLTGQGGEAFSIGQRDPLMAADGHSLEALRAHHRTHPRAASGVPLVVHHRREPHQVLARRADAGHPDFLVAQLLPDEGLSAVGVLAPEVRSIAQLGAAILDAEIHRLRRAALDEDAVVAGEAHLRPEEAARVGFAPEAGEGRAGADHVAATGGGACARERPGHEEQRIGGI